MLLKIIKSLFFLFFINEIHPDSSKYNSLGMQGGVGLVNTPTARFFNRYNLAYSYSSNESYKLNSLTFMPFDFIELKSSRISEEEIKVEGNINMRRDSSSIKFRIKEEGIFPALAIGFNNFDGPAHTQSEYIVSSYGIENIDFSFGIGWGALNNYNHSKNIFRKIDSRFKTREFFYDPNSNKHVNFFSGEHMSYFGGINYVISQNVLFKLEYDSSINQYDESEQGKSKFNYGFELIGINNLNFGIYSDKENKLSLRLSYVLFSN